MHMSICQTYSISSSIHNRPWNISHVAPKTRAAFIKEMWLPFEIEHNFFWCHLRDKFLFDKPHLVSLGKRDVRYVYLGEQGISNTIISLRISSIAPQRRFNLLHFQDTWIRLHVSVLHLGHISEIDSFILWCLSGIKQVLWITLNCKWWLLYERLSASSHRDSHSLSSKVQSRSCSHLVLVFRGFISVKAKCLWGVWYLLESHQLGGALGEGSLLPEMYMKCLTRKYLKKWVVGRWKALHNCTKDISMLFS